MSSPLRHQRVMRAFGSLNDGAAAPSLEPNELTVARNIDHDLEGAVRKRLGRSILAQVASFPENQVTPPLTNLGPVAGSTLGTGTLYVRLTYSTVAGETDDWHSVTGSIATTAGDGVKVWVPFHIQNRTVGLHVNGDKSLTLLSDFNTTILSNFADDTFNGWYVFCRDPGIQDETQLGTNPSNVALWNRTNYIAKISDWVQSTRTFTLDRELPFSLNGVRVDILMPDINGLPVRAANVYVGAAGNNASTPVYLSASQTSTEPFSVTVTAVDTTARKNPGNRLDGVESGTGTTYYWRSANATAVDVTDTDPVSGAVTTVDTGIEGGAYIVRTAWMGLDKTILDTGGWPDTTLEERTRLSDQQCWPGRGAVLAVKDGQGITAGNTMPTALMPGVRSSVISTRKLDPDSTLTFVGVNRPSVTHRAYAQHSAGSTFSLSPSAFRASGLVSEYGSAYLTFPPGSYYDGIETRNWRPDGSPTAGDGLSYSDPSIGDHKHQFEYQLTATEQSDSLVMCLSLRIFPFHGGTWTPATPGTITIRRWSNSVASWLTVKEITDNGPYWTDYLIGGMGEQASDQVLKLGFDWGSALAEAGRAVFDITATNGLAFALDDISLETYRPAVSGSGGDYAITTADIIQDEVAVTTTTDQAVADGSGSVFWISRVSASTTLKHPLLTGGGKPIRTNTTGQWPQQVFSAPIADTVGKTPERIRNMVGCADSIFIEKEGTLTRVYQQSSPEGVPDQSTLDVCKWDWQFTNDLNRILICNHGIPNGILRFDGTQTFIAGLDTPNTALDGVDADDEPPTADDADPCSRFLVLEFWAPRESPRVPGWWQGFSNLDGRVVEMPSEVRWRVTDPDGGIHYIYDWRFLRESVLTSSRERRGVGAVTVFEGPIELNRLTGNLVTTIYTDDIIKCLAPGASSTQADGGGGNTDGTSPGGQDQSFTAGDFEWYVKHKRVLNVEGRGYVVRSPMAKIGGATADTGSAVRLTVPAPNDPQVTHIEFYRNITGTARYFLVDVVVVDTPDVAGNFSIVDNLPDEALGFEGVFETGRIPSCRLIASHGGRTWFVTRDQGELVGMTNIVNEDGLRDPEGFYVKNTIDPDMPRLSSITALAPNYNGMLLCHSDNGIVGLEGVSDDLNSPAGIRVVPIISDAGACGPNAWANVDTVQFFMSRKGPCLVLGREVKYLGAMVEGTVQEQINWQDRASRFVRVVHDRSTGAPKVIFTFSDRPDGRPDSALVFYLGVGEGYQEPSRLWAKWTEWYAHGLVATEDDLGQEYMLIADHWGRLYRHGDDTTDAGLFIESELKTAPITFTGGGKSFRPRFVYVHSTGESGDVVSLDILKDYGGDPVNPRPLRLDMGGTGGFAWNDGALWNTDDMVFNEVDGEGYKESRVSLGRAFRQFQFYFKQLKSERPVGMRRRATFTLVGYDFESRVLGQRKVVA